jgi:hypothetical protein
VNLVNLALCDSATVKATLFLTLVPGSNALRAILPGSPSIQVCTAGREILCPRFISFAEYTPPYPGPEMVVLSLF